MMASETRVSLTERLLHHGSLYATGEAQALMLEAAAALRSAGVLARLVQIEQENTHLKDANDRMACDLAAVDGAFADAGGPVPEAGHPDTYRAAILALAQSPSRVDREQLSCECAECAAWEFKNKALQDSIEGCAQKVLALQQQSPSREDREQALRDAMFDAGFDAAKNQRWLGCTCDQCRAEDKAEARRLLQLDPTPTEDQ